MAKIGDYSEKRIKGEYDKCVEEFPNDAASYFHRGEYFYFKSIMPPENKHIVVETKEFLDLQEKSLLDFSKAVSLNPYASTYQSFYCRLKVNSKKSSSDEILKDYQSWIDHCPTSKEMYWEMAMYFASLNRWKEAALDMETAVIYTKNSFFYTKLADYKDRSASYKPEEILKDLDKAVALKAETGYGYDEEIYKRLRAKYGKQP